MAIEDDMGPGGVPELPIVPEQQVPVEMTEIPADPGVFEFDDGSAVIGDYESPDQVVPEIPFDGNLAEVMEESALGRVSSDLVGSILDDLSSRQDWEDTYKKGLEFLGMQTEDRTEPFEGGFWCYTSIIG